MNTSFLAVIVTTNLINLFTTSLEEQVSSGTLLIYAVPYLLLLGVVAGISFTFMTPQLPDRRSDRDGHESESWHRSYVVPIAFALMLLFSAVFTYLGLASDYRIGYPLWFSYLLGGIVLWAVILRSQRHLVRQRDMPVVQDAPLAETLDPPLPPLPPLGALDSES
jgi:MFS family permease